MRPDRRSPGGGETGRDVRPEAASRDSEERYGLLFERATDGIWLADRQGRFVDANPAALGMLGYSREEHLRLSVGDIVREEEAPRLRELMRELAAGRRVTDVWEIRRADGTYVSLELSHAFTPDGLWQAVGRDITERRRTEDALRESEERYRTLFETMHQGFGIAEILVDEDGRPVDFRMIEINPQFERLTGRPRQEFLGGRTVREVAPELEEEWYRFYGSVGITGEPAHREIRAEPWDRWFEVSAYRVGDPEQRRVAILYTEITEPKRAEEALRESEERLRAALVAGRMAHWRWDPERDEVEASDTMEDLFGLPPGETWQSSQQGFPIVHPEDRARHQALVEQAGREGTGWDSEFRIVRPRDGEVRWLAERASPAPDPATGKTFVSGLVWDVTERKRAEETLRESEERYRLAVEAAELGRWELVPETGEFYTSPICNHHLGLPEDAQPTHESHFETIHPEDHAMIYERLRRAVEEGGEFEAEYRVIHPGGGVRRILSRARVLHSPVSSAPDRLTGVTLDITEAKELEEERERARVRKLTMLAEAAERERVSRELHDRVAHDMGVAHQSLELYSALKEADPERAQERLALAKQTTRRALDQTRALSAELKRLQEEELAGGLGEAFGKLVASYVPEDMEMDVSFSGEESQVPGPVATQVYMAMREAVRNAVRHSGCSCIGVTLSVRDGKLRGLVEDDGEGFDPEAVAKAMPSWGVGLRSMRERAEMLGGTVHVDSEPGAGTRVELRVPLDGQRF